MFLQLLKVKIQELVVTESDINYTGSISLPATLMEVAGIHQCEMVYVNNKTNGHRITTYAVKNDSLNKVTINGAASKLFQAGDHIHAQPPNALGNNGAWAGKSAEKPRSSI